MTIVRAGKITPYIWTGTDGKREKSWRWSVNVDGKQHRRQGYATKAEAESALRVYKAHSKAEIGLPDGCVQRKSTQAGRPARRNRDDGENRLESP